MKRLLMAALLLGGVQARAADPPAPLPAGLGGTWRWVEFVSPAEKLTVDAPDRYELTFPEPGRIALKADCNRATAAITFGHGGAMTVGPMAVTRAMCPDGSLSDRYTQDVARAVRWSLRDGALLLELPVDSGTLRFTHAPK